MLVHVWARSVVLLGIASLAPLRPIIKLTDGTKRPRLIMSCSLLVAAELDRVVLGTASFQPNLGCLHFKVRYQLFKLLSVFFSFQHCITSMRFLLVDVSIAVGYLFFTDLLVGFRQIMQRIGALYRSQPATVGPCSLTTHRHSQPVCLGS